MSTPPPQYSPQYPQYAQHSPYGQHHPPYGPHHPPYGQAPQPSQPFGHPAAAMSMAPDNLAELGTRLGARVLDMVLWGAGYFVPAIPVMMWIDEGGGSTARSVLFAWLITSFALYFPFSVWKFGSTPAKRLLGIRVVRRATSAPVGFGRAVRRECFSLAAWLVPVLSFLNPLWCCWDKPYRQCLHDKWADTMVVRR